MPVVCTLLRIFAIVFALDNSDGIGLRVCVCVCLEVDEGAGVARGLLQGRPLQLPMRWGVGEELTVGTVDQELANF